MNKPFFIVTALTIFCMSFSLSVSPAKAASVRFAWNASEGTVTGYRIYYGTTQGSYPNRVEVGNETEHTVDGLDDGVTYYFVVRAYNDYGESGNSNVVQWPEPDTLSITISTPDTDPFSTSEAVLSTLSGTAYDDVGIDHVSWSNSRGGSGNAVGTSQWTVSDIDLHCGLDNVITVTAHDGDGNISTDRITIDVKPCAVTMEIQ